jgi:putative ABC transport system substrate-binding protein
MKLRVLIQALADSGWTDGRNVRIDLRYAGRDINRTRALAQELVGLQPDIIVTAGATATAVVQRETRTIPIVFVGAGDPVAIGLVPNLNQPGGNITGFAYFEPTLGGKWLELLSEIAPGLKRAAIMFSPETASASVYVASFETAARSLKIEPIITLVHSDGEIEAAIIALGREPGGGLVVMPGAQPALVISAAARNNVPAVYNASVFAREGGLLSYGPDPVDIFRRAATYVDRTLRGAKLVVRDLDVVHPRLALLGLPLALTIAAHPLRGGGGGRQSSEQSALIQSPVKATTQYRAKLPYVAMLRGGGQPKSG